MSHGTCLKNLFVMMMLKWTNICLILMAVLEAGQCGAEIVQRHPAKAVIMACAAIGSIALIFV